MRTALILLAVGGSFVLMPGCASSPDKQDASSADQPPPPVDPTPPQDQENLRNVLRDRPN